MKKLVLLRHGESAWNKENRFTGWTDVDLSEKGLAEAKKAGAWGAALSGAGSSIVAFVRPGSVARRVAEAMKHASRAHHLRSQCLDLALDNRGVRYR